MIFEKVTLFDTALLLVEVHWNKSNKDIKTILRADKEFSKQKNDVVFYEHRMTTAKNTSDKLIAEDRYGVSLYRMRKAKDFISSNRIVNNMS